MTAPIGIGIVAYHATHDLIRCMKSVSANTELPFALAVHDNSDQSDNNRSIIPEFGGFDCGDGRNHGCAVARNRITRALLERHPGMEYLVIMDQDVRVLPGWLDKMMVLMRKKADAGCVGWPCANMGDRPVRDDGCCSMLASVCMLHRVQAIRDCGGWDERFFMYRFDSLFGQRINLAGWRTYVVMDYYNPRIASWKLQVGGIIHDHPNSGIKRNPRWREFQQQSQALYDRIKREEGWTEFDPFTEPVEWRGRLGKPPMMKR